MAPDELVGAVDAAAVTQTLPDGEIGRVIDADAVAQLATRFNLPGRAVESAALTQDIRPLRYLRNGSSISLEQQRRLLDASIGLIGLGGLGGHVLDACLRLGVGTIAAADGDRFEASNLNRQALSNSRTIGASKAEAATAHANAVNPSVNFSAADAFLHGDDFADFLDGKQLVVDALGGLDDRLPLRRAADRLGIPIVSGALAGWTGYVAATFPGQPSPSEFMGGDNGAEERLGCPAPAVSLVASLMTSHVVAVLTGRLTPHQPAMLIVDLHALSFESITL